MKIEEMFSVIFYMIVLFSLAYPLGLYICRVLEGELPNRIKWLAPLESLIYKITGVKEKEGQDSGTYFFHLFVFNMLGFFVLMLILMFQNLLPLNPQGMPGLSWHLAFNTAISFMTNTNWQSYSGEASLSYFSQMLGLGVQNFLSPAVGMTIIAVIARSLRQKQDPNLGNFWVDMTRTILYILLPVALILAVILIGQGVIQNFSPYIKAVSLEGIEQLIPGGPAASQIAIKQLGSNGGGFFGVNSAYPFENPTPFSNFLQVLAILLLPVAQVFAFGKMLSQEKQGFSILSSMTILFVALLGFSLWSEYSFRPDYVNDIPMEGKEVRLGHAESVLWSVSTTAASNGSINAMHSSLSPLSGGIAMFQIMTGEVIYGGVGAGFYGMFLYVLLTVFIAGLMVGRSPEYLGKKIESREVKYAMIAVIAPSACILIFSGIGVVSDWALTSLSNKGPHGLSEILYAFSSAAGNNGSAFAGYAANTPVNNTLLGISMFLGRFLIIWPIFMICGSLATKKITPATEGTFPTDSYLFTILLTGVILIVGALTFFPALTLGPIAEHFLMLKGMTF